MARHAHPLILLAAALVVLCWSQSCLAYLHPTLGRFVSRDPAGYVDGISVYEQLKSRPLQGTDPAGLWGGDVHNGKTREWAAAEGYPDAAASAVGAADEGVDSGGTGPVPVVGDQSWHFDRNRGRGQDTRLAHYAQRMLFAKEACDWKTFGRYGDDPEEAAKQLGMALHPYQDWVAHGDYGYHNPGSIFIVHNAGSPQSNLGGDVSGYPDRPDLDAKNGPNGRPSGLALHIHIGSWWLGSIEYEYAIYEPGNQRIRLTESMTKSALAEFREAVRQRGRPHCRCWQYFGVR